MKISLKIALGIVVIFIIVLIIGLSLPKDRTASKAIIIDKMYFYIVADISGYFEEPSWRSDLDTTIQQDDMDGLEVWLEKYKNGDSLLLKTIKLTEFDLVRETIEPGKPERLRVVQLKDLNGKTAIKMSEEVYVNNPFVRFWYLFDDHTNDFVNGYLNDLKAKYENAKEDNSMAF
ncbi:MAG: hypothetical protein GXO79_08590 [Chlorobi bacterium]|nr:hypothetical protein [Chlorobiota bacterium]